MEIKSTISRRICLVIDSLNGGGAEAVVLRLLTAINQDIPEAQAHLIVLSQRGDYQVGTNPFIHKLEFKSNKNLDGWLKVGKVQAALDQKLIDLSEKFGEFSAIFSNLDVCHKVVKQLSTTISRYYVIHSSPVLELQIERQRSWLKHHKLKRRKLALKGENLITVSDGVKGDFNLEWLPVKSVQTIYNPFDKQEICRLAGLTDSSIPTDPYVLHVGRVCAAKRHDRLLEAFAALDTVHKLVLLTKPSRKLDKLISKFGLEEQVIIMGFQENPYMWMKQANLVVLSSDYEGLPNVLIEALICGTPVVSTDCKHGPREILNGFHPEWLADDFSAQALTKVMAQVLTDNPIIEQKQWPLGKKIDATYVAKQYIRLASGIDLDN